MLLKGHLKSAIANLLTAKLRSLLTVLGVLVGTASVVALISGGQLATEHALAQFKTLGTDLLSVSIQERQSNGSSTEKDVLHLSDISQISKESPNILLAAPYTMAHYGQISYKGHALQGNLVGASEALQKVIKIKLQQGRFVSRLDDQEFFCVIGNRLFQLIKKIRIENPIGQQIKIGDHYFTIIGVAKAWQENMFMYANINNAIIIPIETSILLSKYTRIRNIIFRLKPNSDILETQRAIRNKINQIEPEGRLFFRSAKQLIVSMQKQRQTLTLFLALIGSISLIVGGIGVMNIMLVSVIERRREIGIRMAVGAKRRDIQWMFITEAVMLTLFGGILGIIIGEIISLTVALLSGWGFRLFFMPPIAGFVVSVFVGIFFGFYPAYKAAQLDPIETLRSE